MNFFRLQSNNEDLGHTLLENVFINHYMPQAPGSYVKVYILGLKYAQNHSNTSLSNEIIAKTLDMTVEETMEAWKYWEDQGILKLVPYAQGSDDVTIEFHTIKELMLNIKKKKISVDKYSPDRIIAARQNFRIKDMFEYIKKIYGRDPSTNEMFTYLDWVDDYGMPPELVILLIDDCCTRGKKDLPYLKQVAKNWFDAGINSLDKANEYTERHKEKWQKYSKVLNFLRIGRQPTSVEEKMLYKWFYEFNYSEEVVLKACSLTANTMKPSFSYLDKILTDWNNKGLKVIQEVEAYITKSENTAPAKTKPSSKAQKSSFNNFTNRTYDANALEDMLLKKSRGELIE
ncbi:MAG: DnaD/DnaB replication protein [Clostridia bacterium]|jgi:DnaD/phage-associated family protein|nr:DnaD/DnaB replication protein [Clostridia bacterium]